MSFVIAQEYILRNACVWVQRFSEAPRDQAPDDAAIRKILSTLKNESDNGAATMIKLRLFTRARRGEALKSTWSEFDLEKGIWTNPIDHLKGGKRNKFDFKRVLSEPVIGFITAWRDRSSSKGDLAPDS